MLLPSVNCDNDENIERLRNVLRSDQQKNIQEISAEVGISSGRDNNLPFKVSIGIQLCSMASTSHIEILERCQSKVWRLTVDAPWYMPNMVIRGDLQTPADKGEIRHYKSQYSAFLSVQQTT
jgi:hypothetical protein